MSYICWGEVDLLGLMASALKFHADVWMWAIQTTGAALKIWV